MRIQEFIAERRDGKVHSQASIETFVTGLTSGSFPDYQLSAWLMAAFLKPLTTDETAWLTTAMAKSGERLNLGSLPKPWVDKHSTGGVGDKTTIVLLPLLAACGLSAVKMSGRGLGITGGTIDKLGSVPGFNLNMSPEEMIATASRVGLAITGQTPRLAPADKVLYSLRDATSTVESIPLIASSILSKKIAGGAETIVLDVKCGLGAFMKSQNQARELARALGETGARCGVKVKAVITDMDQVLGEACGNALEVAEAIRTLRLKGPARLQELCIHLAGVTLVTSGVTQTLEDGKRMAMAKLQDGSALTRAERWFEAQGADPRILASDAWVPAAPIKGVVYHVGDAGFVEQFSAETVGQAVLLLGGGRAKKDDQIDPRVGVEVHARIGDRVVDRQPLFTIHARNESEAMEARKVVNSGIKISASPVAAKPLIIE